MLDVGRSHLQKIINGNEPLNEKLGIRIKRLLSDTGVAPSELRPDLSLRPTPQPNERVAPDWLKDADKLIVDLMTKFGNNRSAATRSIGRTNGTLLKAWATKKKIMTPDSRSRIEAVLRGEALPPKPVDPTLDLDKYTLGFAIVIAAPAEFERLYDLGEALEGRWMFKMQSRGVWIAFLKAGADKLKVFKRIAARDASAIVCP